MKISIITVNYNNSLGLEKTIESVVNQTFSNIEYIIIDGGSRDGSVELIKRNSTHINYWVSEKDDGTYVAMNKGILKATGNYLLFLNSGDYFKKNTVIEELVKQTDNKDIIYGDIEYFDLTKSFITTSPDVLTFDFFTKSTLPHPCTLLKKSLFETIGLYNTELKICADWAFFIDAITKFNASYKYINTTITAFELGGLSSTENGIELVKKEKSDYLLENYSFFYNDYLELKKLNKSISFIKKSRKLIVIKKFLPLELQKILFNGV